MLVRAAPVVVTKAQGLQHGCVGAGATRGATVHAHVSRVGVGQAGKPTATGPAESNRGPVAAINIPSNGKATTSNSKHPVNARLGLYVSSSGSNGVGLTASLFRWGREDDIRPEDQKCIKPVRIMRGPTEELRARMHFWCL